MRYFSFLSYKNDFALICPVYVNKVCQRHWKCLYPFLEWFPQRDYSREGWPLLTVETEVNVNSKSTNERGPSLVCLLDSSCRYKRFLLSLDCSSQPSTKYLFPHCTLHISIPLSQSPSKLTGSRAGSPVQYILSLKVMDTTASHDSSPVKAWWKEYLDE